MIVDNTDRDRISEAAAALGLDLEEVREDTRGATWQVTVVVDRDGGADLDVLTALARELDPLAETWGGPDRAVTFDVSTRGVDAPLTELRHWRRAYGRMVELTYTDEAVAAAGEGGPGPGSGRVGALDSEERTVRIVSRVGRGLVRKSVALSDVASAVVRVEFNPAPAKELDLLSDARTGE